eukprot:scaffold165142_cov26-Tisochrysis_lutea.AAC.1
MREPERTRRLPRADARAARQRVEGDALGRLRDQQLVITQRRRDSNDTSGRGEQPEGSAQELRAGEHAAREREPGREAR